MGYELSQSKTSASSTKATSVTGENGKTILKSAVSYTVSNDTRDNRFDPSDGRLFSLRAGICRPSWRRQLLQDSRNSSYYKPLFFNEVVIGAKGRAGHVVGLGEKVTQSQRFFLGGRDVRGFDGSGIGPRDTGSQAAVGGNTVINGGVEVVSSVGFQQGPWHALDCILRFRFDLDTDYPKGGPGRNNSSLRQSIGAGLLWDTVVGPMSFYWAKPVSKKSHDKTKTFNSRLVHASRSAVMLRSLLSRAWICFALLAVPVQAQVGETLSNADAAVAGNEMVGGRIGLIDLEGVLRAASGTAKVRELLDEQRLRFQREFSAKETSLQETERRLLSERICSLTRHLLSGYPLLRPRLLRSRRKYSTGVKQSMPPFKKHSRAYEDWRLKL